MISYRPRSAFREVGKVFGLSEDVIGALGSRAMGQPMGAAPAQGTYRAKPASTRTIRSFAQVLFFARKILGFPRHLSQHVGGFVLTRGRLDRLVPIGPAAMPDRTFIEWDKDDIDALGMMKVDVLALGMLTCIRKGFDLLARMRAKQSASPMSRARTRPSMTCCARAMPSACSRSKAARR